MNLIEQLGGYEKAKEWHDENTDKEWVGIYHMPNITLALLEHRRKHNIFEVGDKVLRSDGFYNVLKITGIDNGYADLVRRVDGEPRWSRFNLNNIRHATNAEIKVGKRLEGL